MAMPWYRENLVVMDVSLLEMDDLDILAAVRCYAPHVDVAR
jgi:hypothetical protein